MNSNFIVNDYILIWNLLFKASISEAIHNLKQKIWNTYKEEYGAILKDRELIVKDYKNFIPNDDTVYNILLDNNEYEHNKKQVEKYRIELMKVWDKNKKDTDNLIKNIIRLKMPNYTFFVVNKELNTIEYTSDSTMVVGKEINPEKPISILLEIVMELANNNIKKYEEDSNFKEAILELAILNEYQTKLLNTSCYNEGKENLKILKKWLYPYWLMYLGIPKEEFQSYMMRDQITFDSDRYAYEKELKKMNIEEFIDFCIRNQRYIIRETKDQSVQDEII